MTEALIGAAESIKAPYIPNLKLISTAIQYHKNGIPVFFETAFYISFVT